MTAEKEQVDRLRLIRTEIVGPITFRHLMERFGGATVVHMGSLETGTITVVPRSPAVSTLSTAGKCRSLRPDRRRRPDHRLGPDPHDTASQIFFLPQSHHGRVVGSHYRG